MTLAQALSIYINLNFLVGMGFLTLAVLTWGLQKVGMQLPSPTELRLHSYSLLAILVLVALHSWVPPGFAFSPAAKLWASESFPKPSNPSLGESDLGSAGGYMSVATPLGESKMPAEQVTNLGSAFLVFAILTGGLWMLWDLWILFQIRQKSFRVRQIGRVRIFVSDEVSVPFSFWFPFQADVFLPTFLVEERMNFAIAMAHEVQHHRQGDTRSVYFLWVLKWACVLNPAAHLWGRWLSEIQEFACDEILVGRNKVDSQAYARCLVEVANHAYRRKQIPGCATGLLFAKERKLLKRRIEKMLFQKSTKNGFFAGALVSFGVAVSLVGTALAAHSLVQDRRLTLSQAQALAAEGAGGEAFPIVVNDLVVEQLNRFVGTPEGREAMKASLLRLESYRITLSEALRKYNLPADLMAIPIVESRFVNLTEGQGANSLRTAGLWQFTANTARNFGLRVEPNLDERLDVQVATDAALRYLLANKLRFKDWSLSLLAYNMGENAVQKAMNSTGSRRAWTLIRKGFEGDRGYLAQVMAAMLILRNPSVLD